MTDKEKDEQSLTDELLKWMSLRASSINKAVELKKDAGPVSFIPTLSSYSPQTLQDIEIQQFNLYLTIPKSITSEEDTAMWVLENNNLDRKQVCRFLIQSGNVYKNVCSQIAIKICSLEIGKNFIDGLKYFVPVCGIWDLFFLQAKSSPVTPENETTFRYFLDIYITAHLNHSEDKLQLVNNHENPAILMDLGLLMLTTFYSWNIVQQSVTICLSDYLTTCKQQLVNRYSSFSYDINILNELFISGTSTPITAVPFATVLPGYYFQNVKRLGQMTLHYHLTTLTEPTQNEYEAKLCIDGLYLFQYQPLDKRMILMACIPLHSLHFSRYTVQDHSYVQLLHHGGSGEGKVAMIIYQEGQYQGYSHYPIIQDIVYHDSIYLSPHVVEQDNERKVGSTLNEVMSWLDELEDCYWQYQTALSQEEDNDDEGTNNDNVVAST